MGITDRILEDHACRKGAAGVAWFTPQDLSRLGITEPLMAVMQNVQHTLKLRNSGAAVETLGRLDAFSIREVH